MRQGRDASWAAGQLIVGGFEGKVVPAEFAHLVRHGCVGGAILFRRNIGTLEELAELTGELRALATIDPLWVSIEQEGGRVQRIGAPFPSLPAMRSVGDTGREDIAAKVGALLAHALSALGFHQDYAPVLDVHTNPSNPVIGDRAFATDPYRVAKLGTAFIRAMQVAGVAACAKHFPGHGDTSADSHLELPRLEHDIERLRSVELVPFEYAIRAGVATVMTAHILFPALDDEHPATLSEKVLTPLLRQELRFRGVIVSDDLEMKAVANHYGIEEAAVRAVRAGCDQLLICHQPELQARAHEALVRAVEFGQLSEARLFEAAHRVEHLKQAYPGRSRVPPSEVVSHMPHELRAALEAELG